MKSNISALVALLGIIFAYSPLQAALDGAKIEQLTGLKGSLNEAEGVFKITSPRTDVKVTIDGWGMPPFMGLTSWVGFMEGGKAEAMIMGDLVLMQDEVNPVMSKLLEQGLSVTALHNHFYYDDPKVYFMHVSGEGSVEQLAQGVHAAFDTIKEVRAKSAEPAKVFGTAFAPKENAITPAPLEGILKTKGMVKDGMFKAVIGRSAKMPCGCLVGKDMGVNTWAAFAGTDDNALVDGDFVVLETELQDVLKSLRKDGINIVAIHQHMVGESPRYLFLHYWGRGTAADLAKAVRNALDKTST